MNARDLKLAQRGFDHALNIVRYWKSCHEGRLRTFPGNLVIQAEINDITELIQHLERSAYSKTLKP